MKRTIRIIGITMLVIAIVFLNYALGHPEANFRWRNQVTYILYSVYLVIMVICLAVPFNKQK